jgi:hypothetical protein
MSTARRDFLKHLTVGGVAFGTLPSALGASEPAPSSATFNEWDDESQQPAAMVFDTTWTQKLTGKYRAVFDSPSISGGAAVWRAGMWVSHYKDVLKAQPTDLNPVIVIRHAGIPLIMNHEFWERYDIAKELKVRHPMTDKKTKRNPVLMTVEDDQLPVGFANYALHKQMEHGAIVLACNLAFGGMVQTIVKEEKLKFPEARAKALTMMVPGVILQPNGIFGVTLAQQNGCAFVQAT